MRIYLTTKFTSISRVLKRKLGKYCKNLTPTQLSQMKTVYLKLFW